MPKAAFLPVPMAFDVIVVAILLQAGLPMKYAAVLLFTLGLFSIYSFSIVWQSISRRHAVILFLLVAGVGFLAGVGGHYASEWQVEREKERRGVLPLLGPTPREKGAIDRYAISKALRRLGYLVIRRRRIAPPIHPRKPAVIT